MTEPGPPLPDDPIAEEVAEFCRRHRLAERYRELDRAPAFPREEFRAMGRAGWLGLAIPPALGGRGLSALRTGVALYHLARLSGTAFAKLALQPQFSSVLAEHGTPELVERFFRPLMRGELLIGNQLTEPAAGSDAGAIALHARREATDYVLTGTKSEAAFATDAEAAIVFGRVDGAPGLTAFLVAQDRPGIRRESFPDLGERWMRRGSVRYEEVRVPDAMRIGEEGRAFDYARSELTRERALLAVIYLGVARASWEETVRYVGEREAFGRPLSAAQAVAFPLVESWAEQEAAVLYARHALERFDAGEEVESEAGLAKWMATEVALRTIDRAIQFHGGRGYSSALPHEQRWRDVRSGAIAHGPSEVMHLIAARQLWPRLPRAPPSHGSGQT